MKRFLMAGILMMLMILPVHAASTEVHTPEDLALIADVPDGSFILMEDLDMTGVPWTSFDFSGILDGNGHAILNMRVDTPGATKASSFDGNQKEYETDFIGMFGVLDHAEIRNLKLLNYRSALEWDSPCFMGSVCGYSIDSLIEDCQITATLELRAHDRMFGVGGVIGYGTGDVKNSNIDVTLICIDTDAATRDEQFLGGVYATGFIGVENCEITIDGYDSEHGYVHNGGVTGMFMQYPIGLERTANIVDNSIDGKITFFEDNGDRRAYCSPVVGEQIQIYRYTIHGNSDHFLRDERREYDRDLMPEMCEDPEYKTTVVEPGCDSYGYTVFECKECGNTYRDEYMPFAHRIGQWQITVPPTTEEQGRSIGVCVLCGAEEERIEETLPPETEPPTTEATEPPIEEPEHHSALLIYAVILSVVSFIGMIVISVLLIKKFWMSST